MATTQARPAALDQITYEDLYARWEKSNWSATAIDFTEDRRQWWEEFDDYKRKAALWNYSLFFYGEDSVTDNLSPYIDAAPREEQKYFLATQQVDEARHSVFFSRFFREVADQAPDGDISAALRTTLPDLTWGFKKVFDRLDKMAVELRKDQSLPQLAKAVTLYHIVVEATLAQPGQHFITSYLERENYLPGFAEGMANVSLDEQRHIGFGVKLLSELIAESDECKEAMIEILREVVPWTAAVLVPPDWDTNYIEVFGSTMEEVGVEGFTSVETKLRTIGFSQQDMQRALSIPMTLSPLERVTRGLELVKHNVIGEKPGPASTDPKHVGWMFDNIACAVDREAAGGKPMTIQWDFSDTDPWYIAIDNGNTRPVRGRAPKPDVTLECSWEDWTYVMAGHEDPRKLMLRRRIKPHGKLRALMKMPKLFPRY